MTHTVHRLPRGEIHVTRAENVYDSIAPGSVRLVISDGPYGMGKAKWDRQNGEDGLREWYRPHVGAWGRVCMDAASVYVWGSDFSASALRPLMREHGWTLRVRITWDKIVPPLTLPRLAFPDVTEVCDHYTRGDPAFFHPAHNPRRRAGAHAPAVTNVWRLAPGAYLDERIKGGLGRNRDGSMVRVSLHPCQKPLTFSDRIIRASSNPGDLVLEPFGGTCRAAVAIEAMQDADARRYVCIEPDEDGRGYVPAVLASMNLGPREPVSDGLFAMVGK